MLPCPYSDVNICMMGDINHVKAELSRTELELLDLLEKSGLGSFDDIRGEQVLSDPQVTEIVTYVVRELDEEKKNLLSLSSGGGGGLRGGDRTGWDYGSL